MFGILGHSPTATRALLGLRLGAQTWQPVAVAVSASNGLIKSTQPTFVRTCATAVGRSPSLAQSMSRPSAPSTLRSAIHSSLHSARLSGHHLAAVHQTSIIRSLHASTRRPSETPQQHRDPPRDGVGHSQNPQAAKYATTSTEAGSIQESPAPTDPQPTAKQEPSEKLLNLPNILTASRIVAVPALGYLILVDRLPEALVLLFFAGVTDLLDGYLARKWNAYTVFGSIADPAADKLLMTVMVATLGWKNLMPASLAALILLRDVALVLLAFRIRYTTLPRPMTFSRYFNPRLPSAQVQPTQISKYNTFLQLLSVGGALLYSVLNHDISGATGSSWASLIHWPLVGLWYITAATTVISGWGYFVGGAGYKNLKTNSTFKAAGSFLRSKAGLAKPAPLPRSKGPANGIGPSPSKTSPKEDLRNTQKRSLATHARSFSSTPSACGAAGTAVRTAPEGTPDSVHAPERAEAPAPPASIVGDGKAFSPRVTFTLPRSIPSWYVGHMERAMRSLPTLLAKDPPPLVIEVRDARLPITSINPGFEELMKKTFENDANVKPGQDASSADHHAWENRRLVVYTKRDLVPRRIEEPLQRAFKEFGSGQQVMFVDTRTDADVRKVLQWVRKQAHALIDNPPPPVAMSPGIARNRRKLSGAFKHTPTPERGVRLVIVGMPNVGKSSLLNALRRVGTGKGKAVSTAPTPGHTRKLTGTVRITKDNPHKGEFRLGGGPPEQAIAYDKTNPPIYVYDTPGVMVPFLGRGREGAEKGVKLALVAGMKSSLFDVQGLLDYLLYRLNLKYAYKLQKWHARQARDKDPSQHDEAEQSDRDDSAPNPVYLTNLAMPENEEVRPTNDVEQFLRWAATRAPGTLLKGGERDYDACAQFVVQRFREGKLGVAELDLGIEELQGGATHPTEDPSFGLAPIDEDSGLPRESIEERIDRVVSQHFEMNEAARRFGVTRKSWERPPPVQSFTDEGDFEVVEAEDAHDMVPEPEEQDSTLSDARRREAVGADVDAGLASHPLLSNHQQRKRVKAQQLFEQREKSRARGLLLSGGARELKLEKERRKHKEWLIRTGKLRLRGAYAKVKRIKKTGKTIRG